MTDLACSVKTCAYNECNCCKKDTIKVGGNQAVNSASTCCASYCEAGSGRATNACNNEPKRATGIECEAVRCRYNDNNRCTAKRVDVTGGHARISDETECATFVGRK